MFHGKPMKKPPAIHGKISECQNFLETSSEGVQASGRPGTADGQCQAGPRGGEAGGGGRDAPKLGDFTRKYGDFCRDLSTRNDVNLGSSLGNMMISWGNLLGVITDNP